MNVDGAIYAAVLIAISSALVAVSIGSWVVWRVYKTGTRPRPVAGLLLIVILAMAYAQVLEQTRVLMFRLSFDQVVAPGLFHTLYQSTWSVISSKLLMSMAVTAGSMLQLALYCKRSEREILLFVLAGWLGTFMAWLALSAAVEWLT